MNFKRIVIFVVLLLFAAMPVLPHPLGNFSVNQYSRLEVGMSAVKIRQVLDLAEIPTFQESSVIDTDKDGTLSDAELNAYAESITPGYLDKLVLIVNGTRIPINATSVRFETSPAAAGLNTLKFTWDLTAPIAANADSNQVSFRNDNYSERLGWREIVVTRTSGVEVYNSTAFGSGVTDELKAYPEETLSAPLNERAAEFFFSTSLPAGARPLQNRDGHSAAAVQKDRFAELIDVPEITPGIALFGLLLAVGFGALHAMSPGHGKAVVGAYLVGSKGTPKHALFLGLTVTITHTLGVFALGLLTFFASRYILPETLMPFLSFFSGLIVLYIGLTLFKTRLFAALGVGSGHHHSHDGHTHSHGHSHSRDQNDELTHTHGGHSHSQDEHDALTHTHDRHTHSHAMPDAITWKSLVALGVSGGLLPCPSALVLMLSAINLNRIGYGIILTIAFSIGLAATLSLVGLVFLYGGKLFNGTALKENRVVKALPVFSAFVIACLGAVICYNSL